MVFNNIEGRKGKSHALKYVNPVIQQYKAKNKTKSLEEDYNPPRRALFNYLQDL